MHGVGGLSAKAASPNCSLLCVTTYKATLQPVVLPISSCLGCAWIVLLGMAGLYSPVILFLDHSLLCFTVNLLCNQALHVIKTVQVLALPPPLGSFWPQKCGTWWRHFFHSREIAPHGYTQWPLSHTVPLSHMHPVSSWNVAIATKEPTFQF